MVQKDVEQENEKFLFLLLEPLKHDLIAFRESVDKAYIHDIQERATLKQEVLSLSLACQEIKHESFKLTQALKGDIKVQGAWGELVLENVLNSAGLRKDHEYTTQAEIKTEDGTLLRPDVMVHLPSQRHIIVDSKVSLTHYAQYVQDPSSTQGKEALKKHLSSIQTHIVQLGNKKYAQHADDTLSFILMFIPIESAFITAVKNDENLLKRALERNIILVSPTTLMAALKTVDHLWFSYRMNHNSKKIASQNSKILQALLNFLQDVDALGKQIEKMNKNYAMLVNKLSSGKDSVIIQIKKLSELSGNQSSLEAIPTRFDELLPSAEYDDHEINKET